jgi:arsenite methyltransferase
VAGETARDRWASWLLERRHGGDPAERQRLLERLGPVRDRVLDGAALHEGDVLLDVGCGDGLIGFGALARVGESGRVIFSDVSQELLDLCQELAVELGAAERCEFVRSAAEDLSGLDDACVDAVTTRSVVIYLGREDKPRAFAEFCRVLRPGGRLSLWEPINSFAFPEPEHLLLGIDVSAIQPLARKLKSVYEQPSGDETLTDFDERDLLAWAEQAGFAAIELVYEASVEQGKVGWGADTSWATFLRAAPNPHAATFGEAIERAFSPAERAEFEAYFVPRFEAREGPSRSAHVHVKAVKR